MNTSDQSNPSLNRRDFAPRCKTFSRIAAGMENTPASAPDSLAIQFRPMDEYLVRFVQLHETFRLPELQALADFHGIEMEVVEYRASVSSPFVAHDIR